MATILIVDDNADCRDIAAETLALGGHETAEAADGRAALARLAQGGVALVLLDIDMPDMNGVEILKAIRGNPATAGLPVIAHTAIASPDDRDYFRARGFDDLLCKPVATGALARMCALWLEKKAA